MRRSNLRTLSQPDKEHLLALFREHKVVLIASSPSTNERQLRAQRGAGVMDPSLAMLKKLNACTLEGLMCRTLVSVAWDGSLYDCDFNQAANIPLGGKPTRISDLDGVPERGTAIASGEHYFACTAGSGFT